MSVEISNAKPYIDWLSTKVQLNELSVNAKKRFVKRGQVYWCNFGINIGSEISKTTPRPALIVQNYLGNSKSPNTIVVPITHDTGTLPCLVPISPVTDNVGNIILDGQVNTSNIICISKARLSDLITTLPTNEMKRIDESIAKSIDLMHYFSKLKDQYDNLKQYTDKVKDERNKAQDKLKNLEDDLLEVKYLVQENGFDNNLQKKISNLLTKIV